MSRRRVVRGLIDAGALAEVALPEFAPFACPDPEFNRINAQSRTGSRRAHLARRSRERAILRVAARWRDGIRQNRDLFRSGRRKRSRRGKQALILLPEIALTVQFLDRFAERFGCRPAEWHSDLRQKERKRVYRAVMHGEARVVVGARSALFLPFPRSRPHRRR